MLVKVSVLKGRHHRQTKEVGNERRRTEGVMDEKEGWRGRRRSVDVCGGVKGSANIPENEMNREKGL
jgi:hypothetical protein